MSESMFSQTKDFLVRSDQASP